MKFDSPVVYQSSDPPQRLMERLKESTIPFEEVFSLEAPVKGYVEGLKESVIGERTILARIDGNEARLMPFGMWPVKGRSAAPNAGYLRCRTEATGDGTRIEAAYQLAWIHKVAIPGFVVMALLMTAAMAILGLYGAGLEGRFALLGGAAFFFFLSVLFLFVILRGARTQSRLTHEFLAKFVGANG